MSLKKRGILFCTFRSVGGWVGRSAEKAMSTQCLLTPLLKSCYAWNKNEFDFDFQIDFKVTWSKVKVKLLILEKCLCWKVATLATVNTFRVDDPC